MYVQYVILQLYEYNYKSDFSLASITHFAVARLLEEDTKLGAVHYPAEPLEAKIEQ